MQYVSIGRSMHLSAILGIVYRAFDQFFKGVNVVSKSVF